MSDTSARTQKIEIIIQKSQIACGYPVLNNKDLRLYAAAWQEVLVNIPTGQLDGSYQAAIDEHDLAKPFSPVKINLAFRSKQPPKGDGVPQYEPLRLNEAPKCEWCAGTTKMRVLVQDGSGTPVKWNDPIFTNTLTVCYCQK